jgi:hypothetical protein
LRDIQSRLAPKRKQVVGTSLTSSEPNQLYSLRLLPESSLFELLYYYLSSKPTKPTKRQLLIRMPCDSDTVQEAGCRYIRNTCQQNDILTNLQP